MLFRDRRDAGRQLAARLLELAPRHPVVVAMVRGGVPVAYEVARALDTPLDVVVVRKVGAPMNTEFGVGAVAEGGVAVTNERGMALAGVDEATFARLAAREHDELERRVTRYRGGRAGVDVAGRTVVVVDDGLATGVSAAAAVESLRRRGAAEVVVAVPVGAAESVAALAERADAVVCLDTPPGFGAVGTWYRDFHQVSDEEVVDLLDEAARASRSGATRPARRDVAIPAGTVELPGIVVTPEDPRGAVVFAHGSGSSRLSPRNASVASALNDRHLTTLLFDLLTPEEAAERAKVFDIPLLAARLEAATDWLRTQPEGALPIGYFGASTGAAAALAAAAARPAEVAAVVSRGGRPDLAGDRLAQVAAPTLLLVGGLDLEVLRRNEEALARLRCPKELRVVPGAGHLFEEPGTLEVVAGHASEWFTRWFAL